MNLETANRLISLRKRMGLSQEDLAYRLGVSRQAVSKWERGESSPDVDNAIMLGRIYGVSLDELFGVKQEYEIELDREPGEPGEEPYEEPAEEPTEEPFEEPRTQSGPFCGAGSFEGVTGLVIRAKAHVTIEGAEGNSAYVELSGPQKEIDECEVALEDGVLRIENEDAKRRFLFGMDGRVRLQVAVKLPRSARSVEAELRGGQFSISGVETQSVSAKTGGGDITAKSCRARSLAFRTGGGEIGIDSVQAGRAELRTGGGDIEARNAEIAESIILHTGGGEVEFSGSAGVIEAKTGGGDIEIDAKAGSVEAVSGGGDIELNCRGGADVTAKTGGGDIELSFTGCGGMSADLACGGGTASVVVNGEKLASGRRVNLTVGDGSARVEARSGGGDITAEMK